jgi:hypothetical protein
MTVKGICRLIDKDVSGGITDRNLAAINDGIRVCVSGRPGLIIAACPVVLLSVVRRATDGKLHANGNSAIRQI